MSDPAPAATLFERVGGEAFFYALIDRFYAGVETDALLRPLYPEDLRPSKEHLALFLIQYWGGPRTYSLERGHPRLRMRHFPFAIGPQQRNAWMQHMRVAVETSAAGAAERDALLNYFELAATSLINQPFVSPAPR
jgi:hemoglobin